jgi:GNAT superfamily N-acetyltransferase
MTPDPRRYFDAIDATWPAANRVAAGPWLLREGRGGGKRVSATTARGPAWHVEDLPAAETAMRLMRQPPLFLIRPGETALDAMLAGAGYARADPTEIRAAAVETLCDKPLPRVCAFTLWEPLAIMHELWEAGGITEARRRVMARVSGPKTALFGRVSDSPAGVGFCALHGDLAMVHALEIAPAHRGKGLGGWMMRAAALWARAAGATEIAALCTRANSGAAALYDSLQMAPVQRYHYRILEEARKETS